MLACRAGSRSMPHHLRPMISSVMRRIVCLSALQDAAVSFPLTVNILLRRAFSYFPRRRILVRMRFGFTAPSIARC